MKIFIQTAGESSEHDYCWKTGGNVKEPLAAHLLETYKQLDVEGNMVCGISADGECYGIILGALQTERTDHQNRKLRLMLAVDGLEQKQVRNLCLEYVRDKQKINGQILGCINYENGDWSFDEGKLVDFLQETCATTILSEESGLIPKYVSSGSGFDKDGLLDKMRSGSFVASTEVDAVVFILSEILPQQAARISKTVNTVKPEASKKQPLKKISLVVMLLLLSGFAAWYFRAELKQYFARQQQFNLPAPAQLDASMENEKSGKVDALLKGNEQVVSEDNKTRVTIPANTSGAKESVEDPESLGSEQDEELPQSNIDEVKPKIEAQKQHTNASEATFEP